MTIILYILSQITRYEKIKNNIVWSKLFLLLQLVRKPSFDKSLNQLQKTFYFLTASVTNTSLKAILAFLSWFYKLIFPIYFTPKLTFHTKSANLIVPDFTCLILLVVLHTSLNSLLLNTSKCSSFYPYLIYSCQCYMRIVSLDKFFTKENLSFLYNQKQRHTISFSGGRNLFMSPSKLPQRPRTQYNLLFNRYR